MTTIKLEICKETRHYTAQSLTIVLKHLLKTNQPISEVDVRDAWLTELRKNRNLFPDGWYIPPPSGISILFGTDEDMDRVVFKSIRPQEYWPRNDIFLNREKGIAFFYASPVDKKSGIIGDFCLTLYFGKKKDIQNHLKTSLEINKRVLDGAQIGMKLADINRLTHQILQSKGLKSELVSSTDSIGTNTGHTIPASYENWSQQELAILNRGTKDWNAIAHLISKKRRFVNAQEQLQIQPGMAFTIEPRPQAKNNPHIPMVVFHTIALFHENGEKELLTDFDDLFTLAGMDYMID